MGEGKKVCIFRVIAWLLSFFMAISAIYHVMQDTTTVKAALTPLETVINDDCDESVELKKFISNMPILSQEDAKQFLGFIYNDSAYLKINLANDETYQMLTGTLGYDDKSLAQLKADMWAFSTFARTNINHNLADASKNVDYLTDELIKYLEMELEGTSNLDEEIINKVGGEILGYLQVGLMKMFSNELAKHTNINIKEETLENAKLAIDSYKDVQALGGEIDTYVKRVVAGVQAAFLPLESEKVGRYSYIASYLDNRKNYDSAKDYIFETIMDYNFLAAKENSYISSAIDMTTWITGKDSWSNHREEIDRWAEYLYNFEKYMNTYTHSYQAIVVNPSCTQNGYYGYQCAYCGRSYATEEILALGHSYNTEWTVDCEPTCKNGSKSHHCSRCDEMIDITSIDAIDSHIWKVGKTKTQADCTNMGVVNYICLTCGETKDEITPALGHDYSAEWTIDSAATCNSSGSMSRHCNRCDASIDTVLIQKVNSHDWDVGMISVPATYDTAGVKVYTCLQCGETRTELIDILEKTNISKATVSGILNTMNYTGKSLKQTQIDVKMGNVTLQNGIDYTVSYQNNKNIGIATVIISGQGEYTGTKTVDFDITVSKGKIYTVNCMNYCMLNADSSGKGTVKLIGTTKKKSDNKFKTLNIKDSVILGGKEFKIIAIEDKAFKGYGYIKKITVGNNVTTIGKETFSNCKGVTTVILGDSLKKISERAFYNCKKLANITIKSKKLTKIEKNAIKGISSKASIKIPASKAYGYKKLFAKRTGFIKSSMNIKKIKTS